MTSTPDHASVSTAGPRDHTGTGLRRGTLGVPSIVFLVLAAVAPLTGMIVVAGIGIALGTGGQTPLTYLLITAVFLLFAAGYSQMARHIVHAGGFYVYVVRGLGRTVGLVAASIALIGYNGFVAGAVGTSGFFTSLVVENVTGVSWPWWLWSLISVVLAWLFTRAGIDFSAKLLAIGLTIEVSILVVLDAAILFKAGYSWSAFDPGQLSMSGLGLGLLFAGTSFVGFEATGLFSEEAKDPRRTVPRATYAAIITLGLIAIVTTWALVSATGVEQAKSTATDHLNAGDLVFSISATYLGSWPTTLMELFLVISLFAALIALHNAATRYLFALGRAGVLPRTLGSVRPKTGAPVVASTVQFAFASLVALVFVVVGADPILTLVPAFTGLGTLGIIILQALAATAVIVHFRRVRDSQLLRTLLLPAVGALGLWLITVLAFTNFPSMAGSESPVIGLLPWVIPLAAVLALVTASMIRRSRPAVWAELEQDLDRESPESVA